ncbi:MAG: TIGR02453 family protein [Myxococcales bacterium]|nr:TIGR02453 family protein [Myxococcales bacterium]
MTTPMTFEGFPKDSVTFFEELVENNDRDWFEANKPRYEDSVLTPSRLFVGAMGEALRELSPDVVADPRVNRSLFRIYRDVRFSKDKRPYKTNLALLFWEGEGKRMTCSSYYMHLEPPNLMLAAGLYQLPRHLLDTYRDEVADPAVGPALSDIVATLEASETYQVGGERYKRVPRGYDKEHPRAELLKRKGLYTWLEVPVPEEFFSAELVGWCLNHWRAMEPLHAWMRAMTTQYEPDEE